MVTVPKFVTSPRIERNTVVYTLRVRLDVCALSRIFRDDPESAHQFQGNQHLRDPHCFDAVGKDH